jgi:hypothetical protein
VAARIAAMSWETGLLADRALVDSLLDRRLERSTLVRSEQLTSDRPLMVRRWAVAVPTTANRWTVETVGGARTDRFAGREGRLAVALTIAAGHFAIVDAEPAS